MTVFAYLRVSTDRQDVDNQRFGILDYANAHSLGSLRFVEDSVSGKTSWKHRKLGELLEIAKSGDTVVFAEVSRMARNTLQVLDILQYCINRKITVHVAKQKMILDDSMQSRITATVLGLAAEIEREFISMRTKESLARLKFEGKSLGRPKGRESSEVKLDRFSEQIEEYLAKGISKTAIAKLCDCSPGTVYNWLRRNKIKIA